MDHPIRPRSPFREALDYFVWFYTPFRRMTASGIYELVSTNAFTERGLYLNLGYWETARTIDQACEALVLLVAEAASMGPADDVADMGFGFAEQDVLWMRRFGPRRIVGFNVTPTQVRIARERVAALGLSDRIDLREGSATATGLPDACCEVVTAVECAFHFDTRERFFAEAFRILRPGGRLVLADVVRNAPTERKLRAAVRDLTWSNVAGKMAVPRANTEHRENYPQKLRAAGFESPDVRSIRDHVFPGWHQALGEDPALLRRFHIVGRMATRLLIHLRPDWVYDAFDYVLAVARKPAGAGG